MENNENVLVLTDDAGKETQFEVITVLEVDDNEYYVVCPVDSNEDDDEAMVLKLDVNEDKEEVLTTVEDDDEFEKVAQAYDEWVDSQDDEEWDEDEDDDK